MVLVCQVILQISKGYLTLWIAALKTNEQSSSYGHHRHCGSKDMFLVCLANLQDRAVKG